MPLLSSWLVQIHPIPHPVSAQGQGNLGDILLRRCVMFAMAAPSKMIASKAGMSSGRTGCEPGLNSCVRIRSSWQLISSDLVPRCSFPMLGNDGMPDSHVRRIHQGPHHVSDRICSWSRVNSHSYHIKQLLLYGFLLHWLMAE